MKRRRILGLLVLMACEGPTVPAGSWTWTQVVSGLERTILDVEYGRGIYVVVGLGGGVASSTDALTWTAHPDQFGPDDVVTGLTFAEEFGLFVAGSGDEAGLRRTIATSPDGRTWTRVATPRGEPIREVKCHGPLCVAVGDDGVILRSTDLATWEDVSFNSDPSFRWISVIQAGGEFIVTGGHEQVARSSDGLTWEVERIGIVPGMAPQCTPVGPECIDVDDIAFTGERFLVVTHPEGAVWASEDLEHWRRRETGLPMLPVHLRGLWSVFSGAGVTLVGGGGGKLAVSYDHGDTWAPQDAGFQGEDIWTITEGAGRYLVGGEDGLLALGTGH